MPAVEEAKGVFACGGVENLPFLNSCSKLSLGHADVQLEPRSLGVPELCLSLQPFPFVCSSTKGHCWGDEVGVSLIGEGWQFSLGQADHMTSLGSSVLLSVSPGIPIVSL